MTEAKSIYMQLGAARSRIVECLGGSTPNSPGFFEPSAHEDALSAFAAHISRLSLIWRNESDPLVIALLSAGRFLDGDIRAANRIIECFPATPYRIDHGIGVCLITPFLAIQSGLPLPPHLSKIEVWLQGSDAQTMLRLWIDKHSSELQWDNRAGKYFFARSAIGS